MQRLFLRAIVFSAAFVLLSHIAVWAFEAASDYDFRPIRPGGLYAGYHFTLAVIMTVLLAPAWLFELIRYFVGVDLMHIDWLCYTFPSLFYGFLIAYLLHRFTRSTRRVEATPPV